MNFCVITRTQLSFRRLRRKYVAFDAMKKQENLGEISTAFMVKFGVKVFLRLTYRRIVNESQFLPAMTWSML